MRVVSSLEAARAALYELSRSGVVRAVPNEATTAITGESCSPLAGEPHRPCDGVGGARAPIRLSSPPYAACHAGVGYYRALVAALRAEFPSVDFTFTLCCGDDAAIAHEALAMGLRHVLCGCNDGQFAQLCAAAAGIGATVSRPAMAPGCDKSA